MQASTTPQPEMPKQPVLKTPMPRPAGFFSRAEAFIIDLIILGVVNLVGSTFVQAMIRFFRLTDLVNTVLDALENATTQIAVGSVVITLVVIGYFTFFWTLVGFTPGKAILGLRVVKRNGEKISFFRALVRFFSYWISAIPLFLGYFWVLWDSKRQAWHDKIAGTQVIYIPKKPQ